MSFQRQETIFNFSTIGWTKLKIEKFNLIPETVLFYVQDEIVGNKEFKKNKYYMGFT